MVTVSVVIPCYNYGHLLPTCLDSVLSQEGVETRVLIIDDASPDGSGAVVRALAESDSRIEALVHEVNRGHIATYNEGLDWADGDYVVLLSSDDLLTPGSLLRATALMQAHPEVGFTYGYSMYFDGGEPHRPLRLTGHKTRVWAGEDWIERRCRAADNVISSPEVVVRTSLQKQVGGYRADLPHAGDLEMWLRLAAQADVGVVTGVDQALYRVHDKSMSRTTYATVLADVQQRYAAFLAVLDSPAGRRLGRRETLKTMAARATARRALWKASRVVTEPDGTASEAAQAMADFAMQIYPSAARLPEYRAWIWAKGPARPPLWTHVPVALTALRGRAQSWWFWRSRKWRCA